MGRFARLSTSLKRHERSVGYALTGAVVRRVTKGVQVLLYAVDPAARSTAKGRASSLHSDANHPIGGSTLGGTCLRERLARPQRDPSFCRVPFRTRALPLRSLAPDGDRHVPRGGDLDGWRTAG